MWIVGAIYEFIVYVIGVVSDLMGAIYNTITATAAELTDYVLPKVPYLIILALLFFAFTKKAQRRRTEDAIEKAARERATWEAESKTRAAIKKTQQKQLKKSARNRAAREKAAREKAAREKEQLRKEKAEAEAKAKAAREKAAREKAAAKAESKRLEEEERRRRQPYEDEREDAKGKFISMREKATATTVRLASTMNEEFLERLHHDFEYAPHFVASKSWVLDLWGAMGKPKPNDDWHPWHSWVMRIAYAISMQPIIHESPDLDEEDFRGPKRMPGNKKELISSLVGRFHSLQKTHKQVYVNVCENATHSAMGLQFLSLFDEEVESKHPSLYMALVEGDWNYGHGKCLLDGYDGHPDAIRRVVVGEEDEEAVAFDLDLDYAKAISQENLQQPSVFADEETSGLLLDLANGAPRPDGGDEWNLLETPPIESDGLEFSSIRDNWDYDCELVLIFRCVELDLDYYYQYGGESSRASIWVADALGEYYRNKRESEASEKWDLDSKTVIELQSLLRELGLPTSGKKSELIERISAHRKL